MPAGGRDRGELLEEYRRVTAFMGERWDGLGTFYRLEDRDGGRLWTASLRGDRRAFCFVTSAGALEDLTRGEGIGCRWCGSPGHTVENGGALECPPRVPAPITVAIAETELGGTVLELLDTGPGSGRCGICGELVLGCESSALEVVHASCERGAGS